MITGCHKALELARKKEECKARAEIEQLQAKVEKFEQAEQRLIEEFEIKSYEYGIYSGEITPSEQDETNETNETCLPSTAQEEPLEVIELDDKVIYNLKEEANRHKWKSNVYKWVAPFPVKLLI